MCCHTGLLTVCFVCLFMSASSTGFDEKNLEENSPCDWRKLYELYSVNGSLSLQGLSKVLKALPSDCFSHSLGNVTTDIKEHSHLPEVISLDSSLNSTKNDVNEESTTSRAWLYACASVLFISTCGLAAVAIIKVLPQWLFQPAIQFLVALAVGTLTGDAILHLIPHAFVPVHHHDYHRDHLNSRVQVLANTNISSSSNLLQDSDHEHIHGDTQLDHDLIVWKGLVVLIVITVFFVIERILNIVGERRQRLQSSKQMDKVAHLLSGSNKGGGEQPCKNRENELEVPESNDRSSSPLNPDANVLVLSETNTNGVPVCLSTDTEACLGAALPKECSQSTENGSCSERQGLLVGNPLIHCTSHEICDGSDGIAIEALRKPNIDTSTIRPISTHRESNHSLPRAVEEAKDSVTFYISEHHTSHHGHSHSHGHIHARPDGVASLAWLVLAGDGLHNLSDGLAIGAAFAASITGGFTTALAVLFHELPHELGDFAVLLKAGMTVKQALICNLISSFLCLIGVLVGLAIGSAHDTAPWIFASTGGMFLYIALVDMMPELNGHLVKNHSAFVQLFIQLAGLVSGFCVMLVIALYEHELSQILQS